MGPVMVVLAGMAAGAPAGAEVVEIPEWRQSLAAHGVTGTVAVRRLGEKRSFASDLDGIARGLAPAATFQIPQLLIAVETGVAGDPDASIPPALAVSSEPAFRTVARSIGEQRMAAWLTRLGYGNAAITGGIDRFWLDGGLTVSPAQQLDFLERLLLGTLPASTRSQVAARDSVPAELLGCDSTLRGKAGWARPNGDDGADVGWWIGWVERPREVWLFATAVEGHPERLREARRGVTLKVLERLGIVGAAACGRTAGLAEPAT